MENKLSKLDSMINEELKRTMKPLFELEEEIDTLKEKIKRKELIQASILAEAGVFQDRLSQLYPKYFALFNHLRNVLEVSKDEIQSMNIMRI